MRSLSLLVAAACLLAAPFASAARCSPLGTVSITVERDATAAAGPVATGDELAEAVAGSYALSNGHWVELIDRDPWLIAEFDNRRQVELKEVGPQLFSSRGGDVQMAWIPGEPADTILLSYPADSKGRLRRNCS